MHFQIPEPPSSKTKPRYVKVKPGSSVYVQLAYKGAPPPNYQWIKNGMPLEGQTGQALVIDEVNSSHSGAYTCEMKNIAGSFVWEEVTVSVMP